jgi:hypothetical protein
VLLEPLETELSVCDALDFVALNLEAGSETQGESLVVLENENRPIA